MAKAARVGADLSVEEALEGWPRKARNCFNTLREAVRIEGSEWAGKISALGRQPVPILNLGERNICQVYPDGNGVVVRLIRGEDVLEAVRKSRKLSARVKRDFARPGKLNFLAELPVTGVEDARVASTILALKADCMNGRSSPGRSAGSVGRRSSAKRKSV